MPLVLTDPYMNCEQRPRYTLTCQPIYNRNFGNILCALSLCRFRHMLFNVVQCNSNFKLVQISVGWPQRLISAPLSPYANCRHPIIVRFETISMTLQWQVAMSRVGYIEIMQITCGAAFAQSESIKRREEKRLVLDWYQRQRSIRYGLTSKLCALADSETNDILTATNEMCGVSSEETNSVTLSTQKFMDPYNNAPWNLARKMCRSDKIDRK